MEDVLDIHDKIRLQIQLLQLQQVEQSFYQGYLVLTQVQLCYLGEVLQALDLGDVVIA